MFNLAIWISNCLPLIPSRFEFLFGFRFFGLGLCELVFQVLRGFVCRREFLFQTGVPGIQLSDLGFKFFDLIPCGFKVLVGRTLFIPALGELPFQCFDRFIG